MFGSDQRWFGSEAGCVPVRHVGKLVLPGAVHQIAEPGEALAKRNGHLPPLGVRGLGALLGEGRPQQGDRCRRCFAGTCASAFRPTYPKAARDNRRGESGVRRSTHPVIGHRCLLPKVPLLKLNPRRGAAITPSAAAATTPRAGTRPASLAEALGKSEDTISVYRHQGVPEREAKMVGLACAAIAHGLPPWGAAKKAK